MRLKWPVVCWLAHMIINPQYCWSCMTPANNSRKVQFGINCNLTLKAHLVRYWQECVGVDVQQLNSLRGLKLFEWLVIYKIKILCQHYQGRLKHLTKCSFNLTRSHCYMLYSCIKRNLKRSLFFFFKSPNLNESKMSAWL